MTERKFPCGNLRTSGAEQTPWDRQGRPTTRQQPMTDQAQKSLHLPEGERSLCNLLRVKRRGLQSQKWKGNLPPSGSDDVPRPVPPITGTSIHTKAVRDGKLLTTAEPTITTYIVSTTAITPSATPSRHTGLECGSTPASWGL